MADALGHPEVHWKQQPAPIELPANLKGNKELDPERLRKKVDSQIGALNL